MKMFKLISAVVVATLLSAGSFVTHRGIAVYQQGVPVNVQGSVCTTEFSVLSVIKEYEAGDFSSSVALYETYLADGTCANMPTPMTVVHTRLVYSFGDAIAFAIRGNDGELFMVAKGAEWVGEGDPA